MKPAIESIYLLLTDQCNSHCAFCYKQSLKEKYNGIMSKETALEAMDFVFNNLKLTENLSVYFWGGEPLLGLEIIKKVISVYPQLKYYTNTNCLLLTKEEVREYLDSVANSLTVTFSLGSAKQHFDSLDNALDKLSEAVKLLIKHNWRVNYVVTDTFSLYEDFKKLYERGIKGITFDLPNKVHLSDEALEEFVQQYLRILDDFSLRFGQTSPSHNLEICDNLFFEKYRPEKLKRWRFCDTGLKRLLVGPEGRVWQCDGFYIIKENCLGDIRSGVDLSKTDYLLKYYENENLMSKYCEGCEIYGYCPRCKCMGLNLDANGDALKPEKEWCWANKAMFKVAKTYFEKMEAHK